MTAPKLLVQFLVVVWLTTASSTSLAQDSNAVMGVDIAGFGRNAQEQDQLLNSLHTAGVRVVRNWIGSDASYEFIKKAFALGIETELTLWVAFPPNAPKRAVVADMPWMYAANLRRPPIFATSLKHMCSRNVGRREARLENPAGSLSGD